MKTNILIVQRSSSKFKFKSILLRWDCLFKLVNLALPSVIGKWFFKPFNKIKIIQIYGIIKVLRRMKI